MDGRDVTDDAVVFGARDYADVEVLISDGSGRIEGRVLIDPDTALPSFEQARRDLGLPPQSPDGVRSPYAVVVFPVNSGRWFYRSRYLRLGSSLLDGRFRMSGLPPGEYWVAAVRTRFMENAYGAWQDAEFFTGLLPNAQRVRIADGEAIEVEIRPAPDVR